MVARLFRKQKARVRFPQLAPICRLRLRGSIPLRSNIRGGLDDLKTYGDTVRYWYRVQLPKAAPNFKARW